MKEEEKEERMRRCNHHVFFVIQNGYNDQDIYFSPIVECVKCGLTNKHIQEDEFHSWLFNCEYESMESKVYKELMNIEFSEYENLDYLNNDGIDIYEPFIFYHLAKQVNLSLDINSKESYSLILNTMEEIDNVIKQKNLDIHYYKDLLHAIEICNNNKVYKKEIK